MDSGLIRRDVSGLRKAGRRGHRVDAETHHSHKEVSPWTTSGTICATRAHSSGRTCCSEVPAHRDETVVRRRADGAPVQVPRFGIRRDQRRARSRGCGGRPVVGRRPTFGSASRRPHPDRRRRERRLRAAAELAILLDDLVGAVSLGPCCDRGLGHRCVPPSRRTPTVWNGTCSSTPRGWNTLCVLPPVSRGRLKHAEVDEDGATDQAGNAGPAASAPELIAPATAAAAPSVRCAAAQVRGHGRGAVVGVGRTGDTTGPTVTSGADSGRDHRVPGHLRSPSG